MPPIRLSPLVTSSEDADDEACCCCTAGTGVSVGFVKADCFGNWLSGCMPFAFSSFMMRTPGIIR